jgi:hypothetical protein
VWRRAWGRELSQLFVDAFSSALKGGVLVITWPARTPACHRENQRDLFHSTPRMFFAFARNRHLLFLLVGTDAELVFFGGTSTQSRESYEKKTEAVRR